jgi:hypothetical protein
VSVRAELATPVIKTNIEWGWENSRLTQFSDKPSIALDESVSSPRFYGVFHHGPYAGNVPESFPYVPVFSSSHVE